MPEDEKLTDIERDAIRKVSGKLIRYSLWTLTASGVFFGAAILATDLRLAGVGFLLLIASCGVFGVSCGMTAKSNEARMAEMLHTSARAKKQKADRERQRVEDMERDLGMRD